MSKQFTYALLFGLLVTPAVQAQHSEEEHHFDIYLARPTSGTQTVYGGIDVGEGEIEVGHRVFESEFGVIPYSGTLGAFEPGFNNPGTSGSQAPGASAMNPGDTPTFANAPFFLDGQIADLFYWDGVGAEPSFAPAAGVSFSIDDPELSAAADGSFDDHPELLLDDGDGLQATLPADGIYLAAFTAALPGLEPTDPLFLVIVTDELLEPAVEVAFEFVESTVIPEPTALMLAGVSLAALAARRRG